MTKEEQQQYEKEKRKDPKLKHKLLLRLRKMGLATISELDKHPILFDSSQERPPTDKVQKATQPDVHFEKVIDLAGWLKAATDDVKVEKGLLRVAKDKFKEKTKRLDIQRKEKIAPKTDMQEPARLQHEKDVARLCALEVKQEDLEASLGLQQDMCEEMVEIMKGLIQQGRLSYSFAPSIFLRHFLYVKNKYEGTFVL